MSFEQSFMRNQPFGESYLKGLIESRVISAGQTIKKGDRVSKQVDGTVLFFKVFGMVIIQFMTVYSMVLNHLLNTCCVTTLKIQCIINLTI
jgi:hypothetical protein